MPNVRLRDGFMFLPFIGKRGRTVQEAYPCGDGGQASRAGGESVEGKRGGASPSARQRKAKC